MAEEFYQLPESPVYNAESIRKIQDTDPVRASTIINPVISKLIENTHAVKQLADKAQQEAASAAAAEEYSSESVYDAGSYCTRGGKLYKANQDILSAEPWTEAHWTETDIAAELVDIYTALSNKAPAGYGLGGSCVTIEDWNTAIKNGWYRNRTADPEAHTPDNLAWYGIVVNYIDSLIIQIAFHADTPINIKSAIRTCHQGTWGEWLYITPPNVTGVEYRTVELYQGKPVYVKLVNFGAAPNNSEKQVSIGTSDIQQLVRFNAAFANGDALPYENSTNNSHAKVSLVAKTGSGIIRITTDHDFSASSIYVLVAYTKTTD